MTSKEQKRQLLGNWLMLGLTVAAATASAFDRIVGRAGGPVSRGGSPRASRTAPPAPTPAA
jgi:hypothetical protein